MYWTLFSARSRKTQIILLIQGSRTLQLTELAACSCFVLLFYSRFLHWPDVISVWCLKQLNSKLTFALYSFWLFVRLIQDRLFITRSAFLSHLHEAPLRCRSEESHVGSRVNDYTGVNADQCDILLKTQPRHNTHSLHQHSLFTTENRRLRNNSRWRQEVRRALFCCSTWVIPHCKHDIHCLFCLTLFSAMNGSAEGAVNGQRFSCQRNRFLNLLVSSVSMQGIIQEIQFKAVFAEPSLSSNTGRRSDLCGVYM